MKKVIDVMQNPKNLTKYMNDPAIMKLIKKAAGAFGGFGAGAGSTGGTPFSKFFIY